MPIGTGIIYNVGDLILSQVSGSGTAFLETKIAAATSSLIYFDSTAKINSASLNSITVGTASYVSGSTSIITNLTASNISASGTGSFGMVGIGTTSPTQKLHIVGAVYGTTNGQFGNALITGTGTGFAVFGSNAGATGVKINLDSDITRNDLVISASTGYVGIGTASPGYTLEVNGTQRVVGNFYLFNTVVNPASNFSNQRGVGFEASTGKLEVAASGSDALAIGRFGSTGQILDFRYAGTQIGNFSLDTNDLTLATARHLILSSTGNVGIGTSSPSQKLTINNGSLTGAGAVYPVRLSGGTMSSVGDSTGLLFVQRDANDDYGAYIRLYTTQATPTYLNPRLEFGVQTTDTNVLGSVATRMVITGDGYVGIGTTSPTAKVESYFSSNAITFNYLATNLNGNSPIPVYGFDVTSGAEVRSIKAGIGYERHLTNGRGTLHIYNRSSDDTSNFSGTRSSAGDIKISIDNSGNVGIGTTIPNSKLQISGSSAGLLTVGTLTNDWGGVVAIGTPNGNGIILSKVNTSNDANRVLTIVRDDTNGASIFGYTPTGTSTSVGFQIRASASSYFNGGNVGIGTSSPDTKLDVRGVVQSQSYPVVNTSGTGQWVKLGTLTIPQSGYTAHIRAYIHSGYNALNSQDYYLDIFFKTSNASSVDANGFAGNSWYYTRGYTTSDPAPIWVGNAAGVSATAYDLYLSLPAFTNRSHYIVEIVEGVTWANVGSLGQTYPGTGSSTVCVSSLGFTLPIGNVGIGTSTLTTKFNVYDASSGNADEVFLGTIGTDQLVGGRTAGSFGIATKSASNGNLIFTANNGMYFRTSGSNDRMFIKNDGNVGIGTTSPEVKLHVRGYQVFLYNDLDTNNTYFYARNSGAGNAGIKMKNSDGEWTIIANDRLRFIDDDAGGVERLSILSDGNVGIGTTSPGALLEVSSSTAASLLNIKGAGGNAILFVSGSGLVGIGTSSPVTKLDVVGLNGSFPTGSGTIQSTGSIVRLRNGDSNLVLDIGGNGGNGNWLQATNRSDLSLTYPLLLNPNGGNVGIGTTSPAAKLNISLAGVVANTVSLINVSSWGNNTVQLFNSNGGTTGNEVLLLGTQAGGNGQLASGFGFGRESSATWGTYISLKTHSPSTSVIDELYERMRIAADGNVGIGTTNPAAMLHVQKSQNSETTVIINNTNAGTAAGARLDLQSHASNYLTLQAYGQNFSGNVCGIAGAKLNTILDNALTANSTGLLIGTTSTNPLYFATANAERMRIDSGGNVGIGTTLPAYKLDVNSSIVSRSNISTPRFSSAGGYVYGITNSPSWNQSCGSAVNNNATAPDGTTSAGTYTFTSTCGSYDMYQTITGITVGRVYTVGMWVKLGTATNFCLVVNNTISWNSIGGKAFTSSDGLSTGKWTHISYTFTQPAGSNQINIHLGYHAETAVTQQTAGTVFLWNIEMTEFSSTWIGNVEDEIRLPGSSIWTSRGNVGIGTTSPNAKLDSYFSSNAITFNYLATNLNNNSPIPVYGFDVTNGIAETRSIKAGIGYERHEANGRGTIHIYNRSSDDTSNFSGTRSSAGDIKMSINNDGNVGIGIVTPNAKLDVSGVIRGDAGANYPHSFTNTDAGNTHWTNRGERVLTSNGTNWTGDGRDPIIALVTSGNSNSLNIANSIGLTLHNESTTDNTFSPAILFSNKSNSNSYNTAYAAIIGRKTGQGVDANWSAGELHFYTMPVGAYINNIPSMMINSAGNVGIGMTSPGTRLHVSGSITALDGRFVSNVTSGTDKYFLDCYGTSTNQIFALYENSNTAYLNSYSSMAFRANQNGGSGGYFVFTGANVGIGTTSPGVKLQTYDTNTGSQFLMSGADGVNSLNFGLGFSVNSQTFATIAGYYTNSGGSGAGDITFYTKITSTALSEKMRIQADGNVGIGTTSPSQKLHVLTSGGSTTTPNVVATFQANTATTILAGGGTAIKFVGVSSGGNLQDYDQCMISSLGYVGNNQHGMQFWVKPNASTVLTAALTIDNNSAVVANSSVTAASFSGAGTGLTGTAASLTAGAVTNGVYTTGAQSVGGVKSFTSTMNVTGVRETMTTVAAATNVAINLNLGTIFKLTFSSTVSTFTITNTDNTNVAAGNSFTLISAPDNSNAKTIAFSFITNGAAATAVKWATFAGGTTPTATITSGKFDVFSFVYDGVNWYGFTGGLTY